MKTYHVECLADGHVHLRSLRKVMSALLDAMIAGGADVVGWIPNVGEGLYTAAEVLRYDAEVRSLPSAPQIAKFIPYVLINEFTTLEEIDRCVAAGIVDGKILPRFRTTKSQNGVMQYGPLIPIAKHCGRVGMKVHSHWEHPSMTYGYRDAEYACVPIQRMLLEETEAEGTIFFWEHGSDGRLIPHWIDMASSGRFYVTLCAHHLAENEDGARGDVAAVCNPAIKGEDSRVGFCELVARNFLWLLAISDFAYHPRSATRGESCKQPAVGKCACGCFTGPFLLPLFAHALWPLLETPEGLETFINFTSRNARRVHRLPPSSRVITLTDTPSGIPTWYQVGDEVAMPFWGGRRLRSSIQGSVLS